MQQLTPDSLARAEDSFQHAVDLDPSYAPAFHWLGMTKYMQYSARGSTFRTNSERQAAEQLFRRALELDPKLPAPRGMLA